MKMLCFWLTHFSLFLSAVAGGSQTQLSLTASCVGSISPAEYGALQDRYDSTDGQNWRWDESLPQSTIWSFPSNLSAPCSDSWQGLSCSSVAVASSESARQAAAESKQQTRKLAPSTHECMISALDLSFRNLQYRLPASIGNLSGLVELYVDDNQLTGPIPSTIGKKMAAALSDAMRPADYC